MYCCNWSKNHVKKFYPIYYVKLCGFKQSQFLEQPIRVNFQFLIELIELSYFFKLTRYYMRNIFFFGARSKVILARYMFSCFPFFLHNFFFIFEVCLCSLVFICFPPPTSPFPMFLAFEFFPHSKFDLENAIS